MKIDQIASSRLSTLPETLNFGELFSDHMFMQSYTPLNCWDDACIKEYQNISLSPAAAVFHYGQEIFEGLKAYRSESGEINLFRPDQNCKRFNRSATRMVMPTVDEVFHIEALLALVQVDHKWVPNQAGSSLYIRPAMIATTPKLGLAASAEYIHFIISGPVGPYYKDGFNPISVYISETQRRAVVGGIGDAKTGGNYAASLSVSEEVAKKGFTQVLWLDAINGRYVEEVGAMNICFVYEGEKIVTPELSGSILPGITRDSILTLAPSLGYEMSEERLDIHTILADIESGKITEVFGCGTAAAISPVGKLTLRDREYVINDNLTGPVAKHLYDELTGIQYGAKEDKFGWMVPVELG